MPSSKKGSSRSKQDKVEVVAPAAVEFEELKSLKAEVALLKSALEHSKSLEAELKQLSSLVKSLDQRLSLHEKHPVESSSSSGGVDHELRKRLVKWNPKFSKFLE